MGKESIATNIVFAFLLLLLVGVSISLGYLAQSDISSIIMKIRSDNVITIEECENLTMTDTAYCLNDYISGIYKYKIRKDLENPTLEELKEEGGDCKNWAELYVGYINELGFDSKRPVIDTGNKSRHTFAVISDETGYCLLDQIYVECFALGD